MKKTLIALIGLVLLTGCSNKYIVNEKLDFYQLQKQETFIRDGYVIMKQETYIQRKVKDILIEEQSKLKGL